MRRLDISGQRFGRWRVVRYIGGPDCLWECVCDCGNAGTPQGSFLRNGRSQSCGCLRRELVAQRNERFVTHGHCRNRQRTRTHNTWQAMLARCFDKDGEWYHRYGGRGITVCKRWMKFENFLADMGERPAGRTLDRINNSGNYTPRNCRWATAKQQRNNI